MADIQSELNEDQISFGDMVARFMSSKSTTAEVRKLMATDSGYEPAVWQQMCEEVGLAGTHIPEAYGGFGFGPVELGIALEKKGPQ